MIPNGSLIVSSTEPTGSNRRKVWIQKGKNLLNKYALINAALNEVNGKLEQNNTRLASDFLLLKAGTYTISCDLSRFAYVKYNLDKTFNSFISWNTLPNQIVLNSDCYIRIEFIGDENGSINISKSDIETLQLEGGSNLTTYEAYIEPKIYIKNDNGVYEEFIKKDENAYSTDERKVGTWIDGKPLYRKVIINNGPFVKGEQVFNNGIANVDKIINVYGMARRNDGKDQPLTTTYFNSSVWNVSIFDVSNTKYSLMLGENQVELLQITQLEIIFEYTKTTD